ncbi:hypothetical protein [Campylobacter sp. 19-13652]|uniref:hypothetical protein n=1 Tax=Campylobacter sp. 19-13652 TaxID=2840180 RepID=UPI001C785A4E|nr:hypothetical protein [Campylobacter sp. 19-13652]BCX78977.1 hypothetical protein LBC_04390 [Campylobacter sp. 19-13652]
MEFPRTTELLKNPPKFSDMSVYIWPNIPENKAKNAIASYAKDTDVKPSQIMMLVDDTVFGSAKDGMFFVLDGIFGTGGVAFYFDDFCGIKFEKSFTDSGIILSEKYSDGFIKDYKFKLTLGNKDDFTKLADYVNKLINAISEDKKEEELKAQEQEIGQEIDETTEQESTCIDELIECAEYLKNSAMAIMVILYSMKSGIFWEPFKYDKENYLALYLRLNNELESLMDKIANAELDNELDAKSLDKFKAFIKPYSCLKDEFLRLLNEIFDTEITVEKIIEEFSADDEDKPLDDSTIAGFLQNAIILPVIDDSELDILKTQAINLQKAKADKPKSESKMLAALNNFISTNKDGVLSKLKDNGIMVTAAALNNDAVILRVASIIHGILPAPIRIFVNLSTVENFLLENRYWLIEKLK